MAIYNNREVSVYALSSHQATPDLITVVYKDGTHENVAMGSVKFTEDEKKNFQKQYPSKFDDVNTINDEDLKAVRAGVAPASDPSVKAQAEAQVRREQQEKIRQEQADKARAEAEKALNQDASRSTDNLTRNSPTTAFQAKSPSNPNNNNKK